MSNDNNAILPYITAGQKDIVDAIGITQLSVGGDISAWYQVIGGLILQGGRFDIDHDTSPSVNFVVPYTKICYWVGLSITTSNPGDAGACPRWIGTDANLTYFVADWGRESGAQGAVGISWFAVGV